MPETVPAISVSTQQADLPDCYAGPTTGNHTLTTDPRATPSTVEPKHDITAPGATTNEALVKGLQEVVAGVSLLLDSTQIPSLTIEYSTSKLHSLKPSSVQIHKTL